MSSIFDIKYYFNHPHNETIINERCVEIPVALRFLDLFKNHDFLELGAVLPYYIKSNHPVVDPMDRASTIKDYAENIDFSNKSVLSISTIEHIGRGDYNIKEVDGLAQDVLSKIYNKSKACLISWAVGYNKPLDSYVQNSNQFDYIFHQRVEANKWIVSMEKSNFDAKYGEPFYNGNSVLWIYKNLNIK
jgi:hypothetical protein